MIPDILRVAWGAMRQWSTARGSKSAVSACSSFQRAPSAREYIRCLRASCATAISHPAWPAEGSRRRLFFRFADRLRRKPDLQAGARQRMPPLLRHTCDGGMGQRPMRSSTRRSARCMLFTTASKSRAVHPRPGRRPVLRAFSRADRKIQARPDPKDLRPGRRQGGALAISRCRRRCPEPPHPGACLKPRQARGEAAASARPQVDRSRPIALQPSIARQHQEVPGRGLEARRPRKDQADLVGIATPPLTKEQHPAARVAGSPRTGEENSCTAPGRRRGEGRGHPGQNRPGSLELSTPARPPASSQCRRLQETARRMNAQPLFSGHGAGDCAICPYRAAAIGIGRRVKTQFRICGAARSARSRARPERGAAVFNTRIDDQVAQACGGAQGPLPRQGAPGAAHARDQPDLTHDRSRRSIKSRRR